MKGHVLIIEATSSGSGLNIVKCALRVGLEVTFFTHDKGRYAADPFRDILDQVHRLWIVDTSKVDSLIEATERLRGESMVDAVVSMTDGHIEQSAQVAAHYGYRFMAPEAVSLARNKDHNRELCRREGILHPRFEVVEDLNTARERLLEWGNPCILKSSRGTGSSQVRFIQDESDLQNQFAETSEMAKQAGGTLLLEEFLYGPVYSVEAITYEGETRILGLSDRVMGNLPYFVELGNSFPVQLDRETEHQVELLITRLFKAMGVDHGVTHTEVVLTDKGPALVEVNPRLGGGMIGPMISDTFGIDIYEQILRIAFGLAPEIPAQPIQGASEYYLYPMKEGTIDRVQGVGMVSQFPGVQQVRLKAKPGDYVKPPCDFKGEIASVYALGSTVTMAMANCQAAVSCIQTVWKK
ncbi:MAG TPA: ATP-grasp domain-containing protein [Bacilli bacterium]|nr:ATP-grasp domain-containing protein [Bacilli bacterium]